MRSALMAAACFALALPAIADTAGTSGGDQGASGATAPQQEIFDNWVVRCATGTGASSNTKRCQVSQAQTDQSTGKRMLEIDVEEGAKGPVAALIMPFGLSLQQGVALQIDQAATGAALPYTTCLPVGCIVRVDLTPELLGDLRKGSTLTLKTAAATGRLLSLPVPLKGFGEAMDRMQALTK